MSDIRKIYAESLLNLIAATEREHEQAQSDIEDLDEKLSDCQGRLSDAVKDAGRVEGHLKAELAEAQERLASREPGALVRNVEAEAALVKARDELATLRLADRERRDYEGEFRRIERERDDWKKRAEVAERAVDQARSDRNAVTLERDTVQKQLDAERVSHNGTLVKLREAQGKSLDVRSVVVEIEAERQRQKAKGWTEAHDDGHAVGELAWAAVHYAAPDLNRFDVDVWPFDSRPKLYGMGPTGRRRELIVAAALLVAEVERLDRANAKAKASSFDRKPDGGSTFVGGPLSAPVIPGMPCQPPEEIARGVLDLERAENKDAGRPA